jgi:hypothetical protein
LRHIAAGFNAGVNSLIFTKTEKLINKVGLSRGSPPDTVTPPPELS